MASPEYKKFLKLSEAHNAHLDALDRLRAAHLDEGVRPPKSLIDAVAKTAKAREAAIKNAASLGDRYGAKEYIQKAQAAVKNHPASGGGGGAASGGGGAQEPPRRASGMAGALGYSARQMGQESGADKVNPYRAAAELGQRVRPEAELDHAKDDLARAKEGHARRMADPNVSQKMKDASAKNVEWAEGRVRALSPASPKAEGLKQFAGKKKPGGGPGLSAPGSHAPIEKAHGSGATFEYERPRGPRDRRDPLPVKVGAGGGKYVTTADGVNRRWTPTADVAGAKAAGGAGGSSKAAGHSETSSEPGGAKYGSNYDGPETSSASRKAAALAAFARNHDLNKEAPSKIRRQFANHALQQAKAAGASTKEIKAILRGKKGGMYTVGAGGQKHYVSKR